MKRYTLGVLALQGCVEPHRKHIESLSADFLEVRDASDLNRVDGLILPGGESTTMLKLLSVLGLEKPLLETCERVPVWGVCAGAILLASGVSTHGQKCLGLLDIEVERNAYGRQQESFHDSIDGYPVSFIRAPKILSVGKEVQVQASRDGNPVWVQSGQIMATTFHPELSDQVPSPMHQKFFENVIKNLQK